MGSKKMLVNVKEEEYEQLREIADELSLSVSSLCRAVLRKAMKDGVFLGFPGDITGSQKHTATPPQVPSPFHPFSSHDNKEREGEEV